MSTLTYLDSGVLIAAYRGEPILSAIAFSFLDDPNREFVVGDYVELELMPKAMFHRSHNEIAFYRDVFAISTWVPSTHAAVALALAEGQRTGISGIDALHVSSAAIAGASELITSEKPTKPIHRTRLVKVISIAP